MDNDLREQLAANQHDIWAHWMRYLFSRTLSGNAEGVIIPNDLVIRWQRQVDTPYARLAESERESDRRQADKVLAVVGPHLADSQRIARDDRDRTHWLTCWRDGGPRHYECAVAEAEQQRARAVEAEAKLAALQDFVN